MRTFAEKLLYLVPYILEIVIDLEIFKKASSSNLIDKGIVEVERVKSFLVDIYFHVVKSSQMLDN